jgi:hypothetical protein
MPSPRPPLSDLQGLLAHFSAKYESFDAALFTTIFTCLVAGERSLIIRTYEEDIAKVTIAAVNVCSQGCPLIGFANHTQVGMYRY